VSAALLLRHGGAVPIRYWKPIQTGVEEDDDTRVVEELTGGGSALRDGVRLPRPVSPHLAARLSGERIDVADLLAIAAAQAHTDRFIVEGAGGVLVPLNESALMIDLIQGLGLPVIIVARSTLGTINHTLLTIEALHARQVPVAGVVVNGPPNAENCAAIEQYGEVEVLGELTTCAVLSRDALLAQLPSLDPNGRLAPLFRS
jgi:dethiobiotin synthetase